MKFLSLWGPVVLIMALIFSQSSTSDPVALPGAVSDKIAHFLVYTALGAALIRALAGGRPHGMTSARVLMAAACATLYGVSDELHQAFVPERTPELMDLLADAAGAAAGAAFYAAVARRVNRRRALS